MIVEAIVNLAMGVVGWFLSLLGNDDAPEFISAIGVFINNQISGFSGLGAWIPWDFAIGVGLSVLGLWFIGLVVKLVRWIIGIIPTMGGG